MQINKLHVQQHALAGPKNRSLTHARGNDSDPGSGNTRRRDLTSGIDAVKPYLAQLHSIPEVRADFVEAARARLASGEYTTHEAAVETAVSLLTQS